MLQNQPQHEWGVGTHFREIGLTDAVGFYAFAGGVKNYRFEAEADEVQGQITRCDNVAPKNVPLPTGNHFWNEDTNLCSCGSTEKPYESTNNHYISLAKCAKLRIPIQTEYGFIVYFEYKDPSLEEADIEGVDCAARTLQEMLRLILEWQWAHLNLDNNDIVAINSHEFIEHIEIPENILSWLWNSVPDQRVAKYLKGSTIARMRASTEDLPDMSDEFNEWIEEKIVQSETIWPYGPR